MRVYNGKYQIFTNTRNLFDADKYSGYLIPKTRYVIKAYIKHGLHKFLNFINLG